MKKNWFKAICPICGKEYEYLKGYKPKTCSKFDCLQEANKRGLFNKKEYPVPGVKE